MKRLHTITITLVVCLVVVWTLVFLQYRSYTVKPSNIHGLLGVEQVFAGNTPGGRILYGWLWGAATHYLDTSVAGGIGWIRLNSDTFDPSNAGSPISTATPSYRVATGDDGVFLPGSYAWSSNFGWIKFTQDASDELKCGSGVTGKLTANGIAGNGVDDVFARVCSVFANGCSGTLKPNYKRGGWDGCISLKGTNPDYGLAQSDINTSPTPILPNYDYWRMVSGFAWDGIAHPAPTTTAPTDPKYGARVGGTGWIKWLNAYAVLGSVTPSVDIEVISDIGTNGCSAGSTVTVNWTATGVDSCTLTSTPAVTFTPAINNPLTGANLTGSVQATIGQLSSVNFVLSCPAATSVHTDTVVTGCPQCSDGVDNNDVDTDIDAADASCHAQCQIANPYLPGRNNEAYNCPPPLSNPGNITIIQN